MKKHISNQSGIVSIVITFFLMSVIVLIVVGFASSVRREQRQALDRQLSTQAFYAAEAGVNDAIKAIRNGYKFSKTSCAPDPSTPELANNTIDNNGVSYSCLLINPLVSSIEVDNLGLDKSEVFPLEGESGKPITEIDISWQRSNGTPRFINGCPSGTPYPLPSISGWGPNCDAGILRVELVPKNAPSRGNLTNRTFVTFLYPRNGGGGTVAYNPSTSASGVIVAGKCSNNKTPKLCTVTINNLNGATPHYIRFRSYYSDSAVSIKARNPSGDVDLVGAQFLIDSTGKANDILRRVQVRVPASNLGVDFPEAAIQSFQSVCKRLVIGDTTSTDTGNNGDPANPCSPS